MAPIIIPLGPDFFAAAAGLRGVCFDEDSLPIRINCIHVTREIRTDMTS
jgi:hypothetical protein